MCVCVGCTDIVHKISYVWSNSIIDVIINGINKLFSIVKFQLEINFMSCNIYPIILNLNIFYVMIIFLFWSKSLKIITIGKLQGHY